MKINLFFVLVILLVSSIHSFGQRNQNPTNNGLFYMIGNVCLGDSIPDSKFSVSGHLAEQATLGRFFANRVQKEATALTPAMKPTNNYLNINGKLAVSSPDDNTNILLNVKKGKSTSIGLQIDTNQSFYIITDDKYRFSVTHNGNIGGNVLLPTDKLHVNGKIKLQGISNHAFEMGVNESNNLGFRGEGNKVEMAIGDQFGSIGTDFDLPKIPSGYRPVGGGRIICEELSVQLPKAWPDYVFTNCYGLLHFSEVAKNLETNGHLPGIPSAEEVAKNGLTLGEMQAKMMEKIEELTLHMIELSKKNEALEQELRAIKSNR